MAQTIALAGKGGVGKTTLSSTLARLYAAEGRPVLAADVDPDANLGLALGMSQEEMDEKVNVNGGAVAVGHPIGATGARILMTLIYELRRSGKKTGVAAICSGMAQGDAVWIEAE